MKIIKLALVVLFLVALASATATEVSDESAAALADEQADINCAAEEKKLNEELKEADEALKKIASDELKQQREKAAEKAAELAAKKKAIEERKERALKRKEELEAEKKAREARKLAREKAAKEKKEREEREAWLVKWAEEQARKEKLEQEGQNEGETINKILATRKPKKHHTPIKDCAQLSAAEASSWSHKKSVKIVPGKHFELTVKIPKGKPVTLQVRVAVPEKAQLILSLHERLRCEKVEWWEYVAGEINDAKQRDIGASFTTSETSSDVYKIDVAAIHGEGCYTIYHRLVAAPKYNQASAGSSPEVSEMSKISDEIKKMISTGATKPWSVISKEEAKKEVKETNEQEKKEQEGIAADAERIVKLSKITVQPHSKPTVDKYPPNFDFSAHGWARVTGTLSKKGDKRVLTLPPVPKGVRLEGVLRTKSEADFDLAVQEKLNLGETAHWVNKHDSFGRKSEEEVSVLTLSPLGEYRWVITAFEGKGDFEFFHRERTAVAESHGKHEHEHEHEHEHKNKHESEHYSSIQEENNSESSDEEGLTDDEQSAMRDDRMMEKMLESASQNEDSSDEQDEFDYEDIEEHEFAPNKDV